MDSVDETDQRYEPRPSSGEAPFYPGEVFYSRTDKRGIIQSGNYVFRRVADYEWSDLIGSPHKIIRHPDMPKGVFSLFWEKIQNGEVVGAYVKNLAKDGLYYWVFAVVTPWKDGYLSARIKPTSTRLRMVEELYATALRAERDEKLSPEASAERIVEKLKEHGFETYDDFAVDSMAEELLSECESLGHRPDKRIVNSRNMLKTAKELAGHTSLLFSDFDALASVPQNMQIKASRLEPTGGPLTALSKNYEHMSHEISSWFADHVVGKDNNFAKISNSVKEALLLTSTAEVLYRCEEQVIADRRTLGHADMEAEQNHLKELSQDFWQRARAASLIVAGEAQRIGRACDDMRRNLLGLNTVRVTCKIENARLGDNSGTLDEIISQLGKSQTSVERHLEVVKSCVDQISDAAEDSCEGESHIIPDELLYGEKMARALRRA